jgi:putative tricarboxylic transport membrane protein
MSQYKKDMIASFFFLILGALVLISVPLTIQDPGVSVMGPRVFPYFIGACMVILSLALMLTTIVKHRKAGGADSTGTFASEEERKRVKGLIINKFRGDRSILAPGISMLEDLCGIPVVGVLAAVILIYAALFQILGYFISTLLAATVILLIFRVKKIWAYPVVYAAAVAIWAGFTFLLSVRLP